ncbi:uncharacterized protein LOC114541674 [Dendronephthya gigantea]|uniref:uncharacterized protein LOC114541674 n=1 Tax=Dendronephthya gigantea TaxID=151771 RepID=UPI00106D3748|nr:uncharacterized protein LOC114541674 [Dendronephthya gigantea]
MDAIATMFAALRLLDEQSCGGVLPLNDAVYKDLLQKHPPAQPEDHSVMIDGEIPYVDPSLFANIDEAAIAKAALRTQGAAGPSGLDALGWRHILVSRNYGDAGKDLRSAIALMARTLATQKVVIGADQTTSLETFLACRLIPLDKNPGVRPIGIGEVLRRIIGKSIVFAKPQIMDSAGDLQLCAGQQSGCEAAVHAMSKIFEEEETDAVLLVDATNAFNSINRKIMLHNIQYICPAMAVYTFNCYVTASRLFVQGGKEIASAEGTTQGDPLAMPLYAVAITPLLLMIKSGEASDVRHVAYADDLSGAGKLMQLRAWWEKIAVHGPSLGYYPRADKSWLIVKPHLEQTAIEIFAGTNVRISSEGHKYLGGYLGSDDGKDKYISSLVSKWCQQLHVLSEIAKFQPQAAYTAFVSGFRHRFTYHIRAVPGIKTAMQLVDDTINLKLLPALLDNRSLSIHERQLVSLPARMGGLGIPIFNDICDEEHLNSTTICHLLSSRIIHQNGTPSAEHGDSIHDLRREIAKQRQARNSLLLQNLRSSMSEEQIRANDLAQLKGSSAWLTALPLAEEGYILTKREFFDAIYMRYRWPLKRLPSFCACGKSFTVDHALSCLKGGFIHRRHNEIRDLLAAAIDDVAYDVSIEPALAPLTGEVLPSSANSADDARVDIAARGFWQRCEKAFFDVRVFNPYASTHRRQTLSSSCKANEREKKRHYNQRIVEVEHGSFTPVVFSAFGGCGRETQHFLSFLGAKLADKKNHSTSMVVSWLRRKIAFALLRARVVCVRGSRSWRTASITSTNDITLSEWNSNISE